jgi:2-polyprenyl-6-methoxyphenol hydroxylase-like FAD-dependent oxidoreductase
MTTKPFKVIIIGAGTGGLCLAHGLKKVGIEVKVYERDRTRAGGLQGYRVGISPDGNRALHECLSKELHDTFLATCARTPKYFNILTEHLSEVLCIDVDPAHADPMTSEKSVSRMTLRQVLLTGLEDIVFFEKKYTHYEQHSDGKVTAFFEDGTSDTGDILVSAEGSNSRVRKQYLPHATLEDTAPLFTPWNLNGTETASSTGLVIATPNLSHAGLACCMTIQETISCGGSGPPVINTLQIR